jgi:hypothetical protein
MTYVLPRQYKDLKPRLSQNLMTFSDLVPSREFAGEGKTGFEPSRTKFRCSERSGHLIDVVCFLCTIRPRHIGEFR